MQVRHCYYKEALQKAREDRTLEEMGVHLITILRTETETDRVYSGSFVVFFLER